MQDFKLYLIIDFPKCKNPIKITKEVIDFVDIIQLRCKDASSKFFLKLGFSLKNIIKKKNKLFIINDRTDIAKIINSDGLHIGQDDISIKQAHLILGKNKIIGKSCHSLRQAQQAEKEKADYISLGPIFKTTTKPEYKVVGIDLIKKVKEKIAIPYLAIGGINKKNLKNITDLGLKRIAVCNAICQARNHKKAAQELKNLLK